MAVESKTKEEKLQTEKGKDNQGKSQMLLAWRSPFAAKLIALSGRVYSFWETTMNKMHVLSLQEAT